MLANWVHIVIVHLGILGTPWLAYRVFSHGKSPLNSKAWRHTFIALILLAIIVSIAYITGPEAADWTKEIMTSYPQDQVEDHALWGRIAFVIQGIIGLLGIMGWVSIYQEELPDRRIAVILKVLLIINILVLFYTAHLGGFIRRMDLLF